MAALQEALLSLGPVTWDAIPTNSPDELRVYAEDIFVKARLIIETVPEQSSNTSRSDTASSASKKSGVSSSSCVPASQLPSLQTEWGKSIKVNNPKENPLSIPIYKLNGKDGKGAWFARRSVHEGLPFSRWKAKMQIEMQETLKTREEELRRGQIPETSIRGIGGDKRLETVDICDSSQQSVVAQIDVYQLSAQFPGPTTPRDFVTLIITTSNESENDEGLPATYMIISKPCEHPDTPPREGYIRGQYESVELIREIPMALSTKDAAATQNTQERPTALRSTSFPAHPGDQPEQLPDNAPDESSVEENFPTGRRRGQTESAVLNAQEYDGDGTNPVEWIMVTRSDPGGSVPRWMVERGTPKSITGDAAKFLNWASQPDRSSNEVSGDIGEMVQHAEHQRRESVGSIRTDERLAGVEGTDVKDKQPDAVGTGHKGAKQLEESIDGSTETGTDKDDELDPENGLWSSVAGMIHTSIESYAPRAVLNYIPGHSPQSSESRSRNITVPTVTHEESGQGDDIGDHDDNASLTSTGTFTSADSRKLGSVQGDPMDTVSGQVPSQSVSSTSLGGSSNNNNNSDIVAEGVAQSSDLKAKPNSHEKELAKLAARKREVETKLTTIRSEIEALGVASLSNDDNASGHESDRASTTSSMFKQNPENAKAVVQDQKRISRLSRNEAKLVSQLRKVEAQQLKVTSKLESRQRKEVQRKEKARTRSEVENLRREVEGLKTQVRELRDERKKWVDLVGRLQRENTKLAAENNGGTSKGLDKEGYDTD